MMIYVVKGSNTYSGESIEKCFSSEEAAKNYIQETTEEFVKNKTREYELKLLATIRGLSDEEETERIRLRHWEETTEGIVTYTIMKFELCD